MTPETKTYLAIGVAVLVAMAAIYVLTVLRDKYYNFVENRLRALLSEHPIAQTRLDDNWAKINFQFYYPFLLIGRQTKIELYVHWTARRQLINRLFKFSVLCSLASLLMPLVLLINIISYHNNVFRYP